MRLRLPLLLCALALLLAAPAQAMPAGAVSATGKKADCVGGRGAPCGNDRPRPDEPGHRRLLRRRPHLYVGSLGNGGIFALARDPGPGACAPWTAAPRASATSSAASAPRTRCRRRSRSPTTGATCTPAARTARPGCSRSRATPRPAPWRRRTACAATGTPAPYPGGSGPNEPLAMEVTPDDRFLISATTDGIGVVNRDPATGALSQTPGNCIAASDDWTSYDEPSRGCRVDEALGRPLELDISPDGRTAYVAAEERTVEGDGGGLHVVAIDPATGAPTITSRVKGGFHEVAVSPDGRNVYAVTTDFDVLAFRRDAAMGALARIKGKTRPLRLHPPLHVPQGRLLDRGHPRRARRPARVLRRRRGRLGAAPAHAGGGLRHLRGRATCDVMKSEFDTPELTRQCHHGPYELDGLTGFEVAPDGRHVYALESADHGGYGTGVVQMMRRH